MAQAFFHKLLCISIRLLAKLFTGCQQPAARATPARVGPETKEDKRPSRSAIDDGRHEIRALVEPATPVVAQ
jgi:hypothetical protein